MKKNILFVFCCFAILLVPTLFVVGCGGSKQTNTSVNKFKVTFIAKNLNYQSVSVVEEGNTVSTPDNAKKSGFRFDSWYVDEEMTEIFNISTPITQDITLYGNFYDANLTLSVENDVCFVKSCKQNATKAEVPNIFKGRVVTSIGEKAFNGCSNLARVVFPLNITKFDSSAFMNCESLEEIVVPDSVTEIGGSCFYSCDNLSSVSIGNSVEYIGASAFAECVLLSSIEISNSVKIIDESAFYNCDSLTQVVVPSGVTSVGKDAFAYCDNLISATLPFVGGGEDIWDGQYGNIGNFNFVFSGSDNIAFVVILGGGIGSCAFSSHDNIKTVTLGNGVSSIGNGAFQYCSNLENVTLGGGVSSIGDYAFCECSGLTSVFVPNAVKSIGSSAFANCTNLQNVIFSEYSQLETIGNNAFGNCSSLTSVTIPRFVTSVDYSAFYECNNITSIAVQSGNSVFDSRNNCNAIIETATNKLIVGCKNTIIPNSIEEIGNFAFAYCSGLVSIDIPFGVKSIGESAFYACTGLVSFVVPASVTNIGTAAFAGCSNIENLTFPAIVSFINMFGGTSSVPQNLTTVTVNSEVVVESAFYGANMLTRIVVLDGAISIGSSAFARCSNLAEIVVPDSIVEIGSDAFYGCSSLVFYERSGAMYLGSGDNNYAFLYSISDKTITSVGDILDDVNVIGSSVFSSCWLSSLIIPNSVKTIGKNAFYGCGNIETITIGSGVSKIGAGAFDGLGTLYEVRFNGTIKQWCEIDFGSYTSNPLSYAHNLYIGGNLISTITSNDLNGLEKVGKYAFYNATCLEGVSLPGSVLQIEEYAFDGCSNLLSVSIGNSVETISNYAFHDCSSLTSVYFGGTVKQWCEIDFATNANPLSYAHNLYIGGQLLTNVQASDLNGIVELKNYVFCGASCLESVQIPNNVTKIGVSAFSGCSGLVEIFVPDSVVMIGDSVFVGCTNLSKLSLPFVGLFSNVVGTTSSAGIEVEIRGGEIPDFAFENNSRLEKIVFGDDVTSIGSRAFHYCTALEMVVFGENVRSVGGIAFYGCMALETIVVDSAAVYDVLTGTTARDHAGAVLANATYVYVLKNVVEADLASDDPNTYLTDTTKYTKTDGSGDYESYYLFTKI